jgi:hypothetical protein
MHSRLRKWFGPCYSPTMHVYTVIVTLKNGLPDLSEEPAPTMPPILSAVTKRIQSWRRERVVVEANGERRIVGGVPKPPESHHPPTLAPSECLAFHGSVWPLLSLQVRH